jgi:hypothetical protein
MWGHSQSRCRQKDEYVNNVRASGKNHNSNTNTNNVEETAKTSDLGAMEHAGSWRLLGNLETKIANRFEALAPDDDDNDDNDDLYLKQYALPGEEDFQVPIRKPKYLKPKQKVKRKWVTFEETLPYPHVRELNAMEQDAVNNMDEEIDSGASENVIPTDMVPQCPTRPSQGSRTGVQYVAANGDTMPNRGEKAVKVITEEGYKCTLDVQVTDVAKPLMSVSKICDAGRTVTFHTHGGFIEHLETKWRTKFKQIENVYCVRVQVPVVGLGMCPMILAKSI